MLFVDQPTDTYGYHNSGVFLFSHDQPTNTYGYYIQGFNFFPNIT